LSQKTPGKPSPVPGNKGLVSIFTGDGKGKTTAAIGTAVRAAGHGLRVFIVFFAKGGQFLNGEAKALSCIPNITIAGYEHKGWIDKDNITPEEKEQAQAALASAREAMHSGRYDLIVLDEINMVGLDEMAEFIKDKPANVELILTGRYAEPGLVQMADLVTEMLAVKHPYNSGVKARPGFDY